MAYIYGLAHVCGLTFVYVLVRDHGVVYVCGVTNSHVIVMVEGDLIV